MYQSFEKYITALTQIANTVTFWPTNMDEIREKYYGGENATKEAFEELCAMVENMNVSIIFHKVY